MRPLPAAAFDLLHVRLEVGHGRLHGLGRLEDERQLHLPAAEQLADRLHPGQEHVVDDVERGESGRQGLVEVGTQPVAVAVDDALLEPALDGPAGAVLLLDRMGLDVLEDGEQRLERVVARGRVAPVVDQVEADLSLLLGDAVERQDAGRVARWPRRDRRSDTRTGTSS